MFPCRDFGPYKAFGRCHACGSFGAFGKLSIFFSAMPIKKCQKKHPPKNEWTGEYVGDGPKTGPKGRLGCVGQYGFQRIINCGCGFVDFANRGRLFANRGRYILNDLGHFKNTIGDIIQSFAGFVHNF